MLSTLLVVLPIFALVFAGWGARRVGVLGPHATTELNRFVVWLALPALLFDIVAHAQLAEIWQPGFIAVTTLALALVFLPTLVVRLRTSRHLADAALDALNASYPNTGFIGFPLALAAFGRDALPPTLLATILVACVLFAAAIVAVETGLQTEAGRGRLARKVVLSLVKNPLIMAPVLGTLLPVLGLGVPSPAEGFLKLLGAAASPCALVALGLFLAAERAPGPRRLLATAGLVGAKLLVQPALAWVLAALVFRLPPLLTHTAVLMAALPTGTGPFMLAEFYEREADVTCDSILASTALSVLTVSAYLAFAT